MNKKSSLLLLVLLMISSGCSHVESSTNQTKGPSQSEGPLQTYKSQTFQKYRAKPIEHIVIVIEENHSGAEIVGNSSAPFINLLARLGANLTQYYAIEHPSEPNYLDLFSGSNQGIRDDSCPHLFSGDNLASELIKQKYTFAGYSEDLPAVGFTGCSNARFGLPWGSTYARKHNPWVNFLNLPSSVNQPMQNFPKDFSQLPTLSFVIPNVQHDMHNGTIEQADIWLKNTMSSYVEWATTHNSLLIVTWDEDDNSQRNLVPTLMVGPMIQPGTYNESSNHYQLLRTLEDLYGLPYLGHSAEVNPITGIWK